MEHPGTDLASRQAPQQKYIASSLHKRERIRPDGLGSVVDIVEIVRILCLILIKKTGQAEFGPNTTLIQMGNWALKMQSSDTGRSRQRVDETEVDVAACQRSEGIPVMTRDGRRSRSDKR